MTQKACPMSWFSVQRRPLEPLGPSGGSPGLLDSFQTFNRHMGQQPAVGADIGGWGGAISSLDRPREVEEIASLGWVAGPSGSRKSLLSRDPLFNILRILKHNQLDLFSIPSKSTAFSE